MNKTLIPERTKQLEQATGLKRNHIAKATGCGNKHLGRVINGHKPPSKKLLVRLATIFKTTPEYLTGESDTQSASQEVA